ncbi:MAG TPA: hypothetical protein DCK76_02355 [Desulfotomaculum sp.]|nr:hypothetical protein [Desulfotomaculum sp.]HBY04306.1 hypothetical protein [Desulfotomaculum sp.]
MAKMPKVVMDTFNDRSCPKVIATVDADGNLNNTPIGSTTAIDDETLAFADFYGVATRTMKNLDANKKVAVTAFKVSLAPPFIAFQVKGTFQGFQTSGPLFDTFAKLLKEAVGLDIKGVGTIKVDEVFNSSPLAPGSKMA